MSFAYEHQTWRTENGLPQNSVHSIVQTSDGYIWLATEGGLARFDGLKFTVFDAENTPELRNNNIRSLLEAKDKSLWIATADGLTRLQNGTFSSFTTKEGLPSNNVLSLTQDTTGVLRSVTAEGDAIYQNGHFVREPATPPHSIPELNGVTATVLLTDRHGRTWIGTNDGLFVIQNGQTKKLTLQPQLSSSKVTTLFEDRAGAIWIGTEAGAARLVDGKLHVIDDPDTLAHGLILSFLEDRDGDIWIGSDSGGLTVLRDQRFRKFGRAEGVPDDLIRCIFEDAQGTLWAGTNGHGLRRFDGETFSSFTTANGLSSDVILSISGDSKGGLWVGTPDGLNIILRGHVRWLTSADGLPDDFVRSIYKDADGSMWMGTRRGLAHYIDEQLRSYTASDGLPSDLVGALLRGKNGCLWIGTLKGLACLRGGVITRPALPKDARDSPITALFENDDGVLWIGTDDRGLVGLKEASVFEFPTSLGLPTSVSGIVEDSNNQLWITSQHGLFRVSQSELIAYAEGKSKAVSVVSYGTGDGLPVNEFSTGGHPTVWKDRRNTLWFASAKGIVSIDNCHTKPNPIPPLIVFERVTADDRLLDPSRVTALGPGLSRISFDYAGLSFIAPQQVRFKYKMDGFDGTWIDAGTRRAAYYTNLPPGNYRFTVLARNNDGVWNTQGASLSFQLRPHLYQTGWFRSLLLLAAALIVYAFYRWRVNHVRTHFDVVMAERNRIAREIHDTLAQGFVGISLKLELARRLMSTSVESAGEILEQAQTLAKGSLAEARRSIWNLRVESLDEDLPSKLSKAVRQSVHNKDLDVRIEITGAYRPLPPRIESEVLRIGQEAVMNVVRHANATRLDVHLAFDSNKAQMTIRDNGCGFNPGECAGKTGHFGLRGMRERAEEINATLNITSTPGGTQVCLELPLK
ncbi:MAG TPA: two-component regulator propeller domain-containing protein [Bryobacteraceae bacterium]|nr:two-component regulator propeller domain-containing protein [Bryobacteraceae bacterium]